MMRMAEQIIPSSIRPFPLCRLYQQPGGLPQRGPRPGKLRRPLRERRRLHAPRLRRGAGGAAGRCDVAAPQREVHCQCHARTRHARAPGRGRVGVRVAGRPGVPDLHGAPGELWSFPCKGRCRGFWKRCRGIPCPRRGPSAPALRPRHGPPRHGSRRRRPRSVIPVSSAAALSSMGPFSRHGMISGAGPGRLCRTH